MDNREVVLDELVSGTVALGEYLVNLGEESQTRIQRGAVVGLPLKDGKDGPVRVETELPD